MSLFAEWKDLMENQTEETFEEFWKEYSETETKIYKHILSNHEEHLTGTVAELVEKFQVNKVIFMGFLDGINSSLNTPNDLDSVDDNFMVDLDIDFEKLYFNMLDAEADYLYTLKEWEQVLPEEKIISKIGRASCRERV